MRTGVIAEFDPFHHGHLALLQNVRRELKSDEIIVALSGSATQRGEFSACSKFIRAQWAILGGADVVFEIPVRGSARSADFFAGAGLDILLAAGIDALAFGMENPVPHHELLARATLLEELSTSSQLRELLGHGLAYPRILTTLLEERGCPWSDEVKRPNNLLGYAYARALTKRNHSVRLCPFPRRGASHHAKIGQGQFSSGTALRRALATRDDSAISPYVPAFVHGSLEEVTIPKFLSEHLRLLLTRELIRDRDFSHILGYEPGLERYLLNTLTHDGKIQATPRYSHARLRRFCLALLLDLEKTPTASDFSQYLRPLAFSSRGTKILGEFSVIHRVRKALLDEGCGRLLREEIRATNLRALLYGEPLQQDFTTPIRPQKKNPWISP